MKKPFKMSMLIISAVVALLFSACGRSLTGRTYNTIAYFGTSTSVAAYGDDAGLFEECAAEIDLAIAEIENSISATKPDSYITRFNSAPAGGTVEIDAIAYDVLARAQRLYALTSGAYNPAVGLLVDLWGFSPRFSEKNYSPEKVYDRYDPQTQLPDERYVNGFITLTNFGDVALTATDGKYFAKKPDNTFDGFTMELDLGGIGKGFAADRAAEILKAYGYEYGYVNLGNSSIKLLKAAEGGKAPDWVVSIASPLGTGTYAEIYAKNRSVSTSGGYYRYYKLGGHKYSHIIDCKTGRPTTSGISIVTLLTDSAAEGDALSTALCVMDKNKTDAFIKDNGLEVIYAVAESDSYRVTATLERGNYNVTDKSFYVN